MEQAGVIEDMGLLQGFIGGRSQRSERGKLAAGDGPGDFRVRGLAAEPELRRKQLAGARLRKTH